jgi:uncharacterized protein YkwD
VKKVFVAFIISLVVVSGYFLVKGNYLQSFISELSKQRIYIQRDENIDFIPDWTAEEVLSKINTFRESEGLPKLTEGTKLDKSAKARLSVVLSEDDVDGSKTGLTREKALTNAGYTANLVGELILTGFFKSNDPIANWKNDKNSSDTLSHPSFKDVGIAIKNSTDRVDVYILLASPRKIVITTVTPTVAQKVTWGGIELWAEINKRRVEMGVNPLKQLDALCTLASIRLNQLLELGKLDGHAGFVPLLQRDDLKWISEKYNVSEYLIQGYKTPTEAVAAWENTLGHKSLLSGGEYVWGCVYAQNTFGVAITAY